MTSPDNKCGNCTQCCRLLAVTELNKPKNTRCTHCHVGVGCRIYHARPESCQAFKCLWLQTQDTHLPFPLYLRPDKSKVVLHTTPDEKNIVAKVDPGTPMAWMEKGIGNVLATLSEKLLVLIDNGKKTWVIQNHGIREVKMSVADETGTEHFERYVT